MLTLICSLVITFGPRLRVMSQATNDLVLLFQISTICNISKSLLELSSGVATYFLTTATLTKFFLALILLTSFERRESLLGFLGFETKQDTSRQMRSSCCTN
jgi:uncharacterized membrane protein